MTKYSTATVTAPVTPPSTMSHTNITKHFRSQWRYRRGAGEGLPMTWRRGKETRSLAEIPVLCIQLSNRNPPHILARASSLNLV